MPCPSLSKRGMKCSGEKKNGGGAEERKVEGAVSCSNGHMCCIYRAALILKLDQLIIGYFVQLCYVSLKRGYKNLHL